ncbi:MAG: HAD-superfamily hydrolase, subfamily IA, variant 3 [Thermotogales bacterium 46_20]|nr:MAG: HAD-superfamily hydrolase, subfamily IA, variant 3 [Thermotogales bacterium 46_20]
MKAVIFDMDGVIFDSEGLYREACISLVQRYDGTVTEDLFERQMGLKMDESQRVAVEVSGAKVSPEEFGRNYEEEFLKRANNELKTIPGVEKLLDFLKGRVRMAIASSTKTAIITGFLEKFGFEKYFDAVVGGDQVINSKPSPEIYLEAARLLGVQPGECLVIEDSPAGIISATRAGMRVLAIRHDHNSQLDLTTAERVFHDHRAVARYIEAFVDTER